MRFGRLIAEQGWRLVYGAGDVGLMRAASRAALDAGGKVFGAMPRHLIDMEVASSAIDSLVVTETMHERKKVMFMNSDAIVTLPGGLGTLDEFFECVTWKQLGLHDKPIIVVNSNGMWDLLIDLMIQIVDLQFADPCALELFETVESPELAVDSLRTYFADRTS